jgi:hypothetical protein
MYFALLLRPAYIEQQQKKTIEEDQSGKNRKEKVYSLSLSIHIMTRTNQHKKATIYIYIYSIYRRLDRYKVTCC